MAKHVKGSAIANASSYKLYLADGTELATQSTNVSAGIDFDLSTIAALTAAGTYSLGVKAISGDTTKFLDSVMSNLVSYIVAEIPEEPEDPEEPVNPPSTSTPTLVQGYVSGASVNNVLATRVRIDGLVSGAFSVECNDGYVIRAIQECTSTTPSADDVNIVTSDQGKTSYSGGSAGKYYAITFCKTNASKNIAPTESIVKSFSGTIVAITSAPVTDDTEPGTDVPYTLVQGAHVQNDSSIYQGTNRVTTPKAIKGKFTVTVNSGYAIRAVYEYTKESGDTKGVMAASTSETRTTFTSTDDSKYYGVTFTFAEPNAANNIAPTENIIASWKYV